MSEFSLTMDAIDRLREFIDGENQARREKFVMFLPPSMMVDLAKEADRTAITTVTYDADGAAHYDVVEMREGVEVTAEVTEFIASLRHFRFVESQGLPKLPRLAARALQADPEKRMAHLRKVTSQDWRGRR